MNENLTPAQDAQQANRNANGEYQIKTHGDVENGTSNPTMGLSPDMAELLEASRDPDQELADKLNVNVGIVRLARKLIKEEKSEDSEA